MRVTVALSALALAACTEAPRMQPGQPTPDGADLAAPAPPDLTGVTNPSVDLAPATLAITAINPKRVSTVGRARVTITGTGFDSRSEFTIGSLRADVESVSADGTSAVVFSPANPGGWGVPITVSVRRPGDGGRAANSNAANSPTAFSYFASQLNFVEQASYVVPGARPRGFAFGDLNNDGRQDFIVTHQDTANQTVYLGTGTGEFIQSTGYNVFGYTTIAAMIVDADGDGAKDLLFASPNNNTIAYYLGNNTGAMTSRGNNGYGTSATPLSIDAADLNGDGKLEVVTANVGANNIGIFTNTFNNNGVSNMFANGQQFVVSPGTNPTRAVIRDINKDNQPDLVVSLQGNGGPTLSWYIGQNTAPFFGNVNGGGPVGNVGTNNANQAPQWVELGDVNNDTYPDAVVTDVNTNTVRVFLNAGMGAAANAIFLNTAGAITVGQSPRGVSLADVNGDGNLDIIVANNSTQANSITVLPGRGDGTFGTIVSNDVPPRTLTSRITFGVGCNAPWQAQMVQIDGDPRLEMALVCELNNSNNTSPTYMKIFRNVSQ